jgi:type VI secretion system protein ImpC
MGDFSGRENRSQVSDLRTRRITTVDRDNDASLMKKLGVSLRIPVMTGGDDLSVDLSFNEYDDFHPETIYFQSDLFQSLRTTRRELMDPDTFARTAERLTGKDAGDASHDEADPARTPSPPMADVPMPSTAGLLDQILDDATTPTTRNKKSGPPSDWDRFLGDIVGPHLVPDVQQEQDALVRSVDRSIAALMQTILHHPDFQAIESAWRALRFVVRHLNTGEHLQIQILDLTKAELADQLTGTENLEDSPLYKKLADAAQTSAGQPPWSLLAGIYTFEETKAEAITLARAGALGQMLGAPFIAAADATLIGCKAIHETPDPADWNLQPAAADANAWQVVQTLPEASWVGLIFPRLLIRLPYGVDSDPVDAFEFEEISEPANHEHYLWANAVFALVVMLGRSFSANGWDLLSQLNNRVDGLPLHLAKEDGESFVKPCTEALFSERAVLRIIERGVMPLAGHKDQGLSQLMRFQSLALPPHPLQGRWNPAT